MHTTAAKRRGFTLFELILVVAIVGILATLAIVGLGKARQQSRDTQRVADIKQIQAGLELYWLNNNSYPINNSPVALGTGDNLCLDDGGFAASCSGIIYLDTVPASPTPPDGNSHTYQSLDAGGAPCSGSCPNYAINFTTEGSVSDLDCRTGCTAYPSGIQ